MKNRTMIYHIQENNFLCAGSYVSMADIHKVHPKGYNFCRKSCILYPSPCTLSTLTGRTVPVKAASTTQSLGINSNLELANIAIRKPFILVCHFLKWK